MRVGILLFDDVEELDFVGPWEVFSMASQIKSEIKVVTISENKIVVRCAKGLRVLPDHNFEDAPQLNILVVPGGMGTRREVNNKNLLDWIAATAKTCLWVTSVCTGSLLLTEAGPAAAKRVTTHWGFVPQLRERGKAKEVLDNVRYVRDGNLLTSAGVSAGIDMSLWLIGEIYTPDTARHVQRLMEYDPAPPYTAEV